MPTKSLKIDSLDLDLENPRIRHASDQRDAMQKIISEQKVKLVNLAESIAAKGFNPSERCLVLRSHLRAGHFIVLEGNRRVLCAKLLKNPTLVHSFEMPAAYKKRLEKAAKSFDPKNVEPVDCYEVSDRLQGNDWIKRRHSGEDDGRGIVGWSSIASARFAGSDPALQALEFVQEHGSLSDLQVETINNTKFLTTLARLLSNPAVRASIGFEIDKGKLVTELPASEALKPLKRIVLDLAEKAINVNNVKTKEQQISYISRLQSADRADFSQKAGHSVAVDSLVAAAKSANQPNPPKGLRGSRPKPRANVVPGACRLNIPTPKILGIYDELRSLQLARHKHAIAVLLRVFLEMSVDEYLTKRAQSSLKHPPLNGHPRDKTLKDKVKETIIHLVTNGHAEKDFLGVSKGVSDANHPFSIDTLHAYIHNRHYSPTESDLTTAWDNAQHFFETVWP